MVDIKLNFVWFGMEWPRRQMAFLVAWNGLASSCHVKQTWLRTRSTPYGRGIGIYGIVPLV